MNQNVEIQLQSGLSAETPLIIGDEFKNIRSLYIGGGALPTYGLDATFKPIITEITSVPKEIFVDELWDISFSNGLFVFIT